MNMEFIGVPGSGKSALRRLLLSSLKKDGHLAALSFEQAFYTVARNDIDIFYRVFLKFFPESLGMKLSQKLVNRSLLQFEAQNRFLAHHGGAFETFLASPQYTSMTVEDRETVISTFLQVGAMHECIAGRFPETTRIVIDEGFVQKSFMFVSMINDNEDDRSHVYSYLRQVPLPGIIFRVVTDIDICYERLMARSQGLTQRLKRLGKPEKVHDFLRISERHLESITVWLRTNTTIPVVEIVNNGDIDRCLDAFDRWR